MNGGRVNWGSYSFTLWDGQFSVWVCDKPQSSLSFPSFPFLWPRPLPKMLSIKFVYRLICVADPYCGDNVHKLLIRSTLHVFTQSCSSRDTLPFCCRVETGSVFVFGGQARVPLCMQLLEIEQGHRDGRVMFIYHFVNPVMGLVALSSFPSWFREAFRGTELTKPAEHQPL